MTNVCIYIISLFKLRKNNSGKNLPDSDEKFDRKKTNMLFKHFLRKYLRLIGNKHPDIFYFR
ncbi:MAG: hypothetical protein BWK80_19435 [Desulfobacteraceae bacterium IS3]|nr:MAG: hypothetical protein BWK80_19435 [Desulfobacteraceae bacterium IS3]